MRPAVRDLHAWVRQLSNKDENAEILSASPSRATEDGGRIVRTYEYLLIFIAFARNSLIRDMTFRSNFILDCISSLSWLL